MRKRFETDAGPYVGNVGLFIEMLAEASAVTIVGRTNLRLAGLLKEAIFRKEEIGGPFWDSVRIVFHDGALLEAVNDELADNGDPAAAARQRRQDLFYARKSLGTLLRQYEPTKWQLFSSPRPSDFFGTLLEFPDGTKIAHLVIKRAGRPESERVYSDQSDPEGLITAAFHDVVARSERDYRVPIGELVPPGDPEILRCAQYKPQSAVLRPGSSARGWLPMFLLLTMQDGEGGLD